MQAVHTRTCFFTPSTNACAVPQGVCQLFSVSATTVSFSLTKQNLSATFTSTAGIFVNQTFPAIGLQRERTTDRQHHGDTERTELSALRHADEVRDD